MASSSWPLSLFGPIPSRRLGQSLGINGIPPKVCTYSCIYCQLGRTSRMQVERQAFHEPTEIYDAVRQKLENVRGAVDYVTFVPDGEPTLDTNLGLEIELLERLSVPVAVITNASLIWRDDVREDLMGADWVSLKVDAVDEIVWRRIDRPHKSLDLDRILEEGVRFAMHFHGELVTETMLVADVNDGDAQLRALASFLAHLQPKRAYLSVPTRPPAEASVKVPSEQVLAQAYNILSERVDQVEYLVGYEGNAFAFTGDVEEDLLSIIAVHLMRREAVSDLLARAGAEWPVAQRLVAKGELVEAEYKGHTYCLRRLGDRSVSRP